MIQIRKHTSKGFRSNPCLKSQTSETRGELAAPQPVCLGEQVVRSAPLSLLLLCLTPVCYPTSCPRAILYFDFLISERSSSGSVQRARSSVCVCVCGHGQHNNRMRAHLASWDAAARLTSITRLVGRRTDMTGKSKSKRIRSS